MKQKEKSGFSNIHQDLIDRSLGGDEAARSKLYMLYSKAMYNSCLRITNNAEDAQDVLQDAFISAFTNLHSYKGEAAFGAWLKRIVVNKAINHVKKRHLALTEFEIDRHDMGESSGEYLDHDYSVTRIRKAIKELPDGYRLVFSLYLLEGYDHKEISDILNISVSTSKSQYNRAKKKIREILTDK